MPMNFSGGRDVIKAFLDGEPPYAHDGTEAQGREKFALVWHDFAEELLQGLSPFSTTVSVAADALKATLETPAGSLLFFPAMDQLLADVAQGMVGYVSTPPPPLTPVVMQAQSGDNATDAATITGGLISHISLGTAQEIGTPTVRNWS